MYYGPMHTVDQNIQWGHNSYEHRNYSITRQIIIIYLGIFQIIEKKATYRKKQKKIIQV